ncbi:hypothetical protein GCM10010095_49420 [Streptomyces anthocyanicus]|nr:hypothetical protein GCM10010095_49420 [Streptomyces anthocyanicus]
MSYDPSPSYPHRPPPPSPPYAPRHHAQHAHHAQPVHQAHRAPRRDPLGHHSDLRILRSAYRRQRRTATLGYQGSFAVHRASGAASPAACLTLIAALWSRSWTVPQAVQVHSRTCKGPAERR